MALLHLYDIDKPTETEGLEDGLGVSKRRRKSCTRQSTHNNHNTTSTNKQTKGVDIARLAIGNVLCKGKNALPVARRFVAQISVLPSVRTPILRVCIIDIIGVHIHIQPTPNRVLHI